MAMTIKKKKFHGISPLVRSQFPELISKNGSNKTLFEKRKKHFFFYVKIL